MEKLVMLLTPNPYSRPGTALKKVTKVAVHYIGNPNTSALANRNYFNSLGKTHSTYASSHYIIGLKGEVIQCVPEDEIAYCTNSANSYSLSIECCHPDSTGKFNEYTYTSLKELCGDICKRYKLDPVKDIIRHYDVTKKCCPRWWAPNGPNKNADRDFKKFKEDVKAYMKGEDDMTVEQVKEIITETVKEEKVFNAVEDIPDWGKPTVEKLLKNGTLKGEEKGLDISYSLLRQLVINDRMGLYR